MRRLIQLLCIAMLAVWIQPQAAGAGVGPALFLWGLPLS